MEILYKDEVFFEKLVFKKGIKWKKKILFINMFCLLYYVNVGLKWNLDVFVYCLLLYES